MSARPQTDAPPSGRPRVSIADLLARKRAGVRIVMVTAYDYPGALAAEEAGIDVVLVGDSGAMTVLGYANTNEVSVEEMLMLTKAVRRGLHTPLLVGDLPFGSYESDDQTAVATARRFVDEAGCDAVKLEGGGEASISRVRAIVAAGIQVMGHVGLTPQTADQLGGFRAQGRTAAGAHRILQEALALQAAGCFAVVLEAIPAAVGEVIMPLLDMLVIGIGAGPATNGQVLVLHDLLGMSSGGRARFVRRYADLHSASVDGLRRFADDVRGGDYPAPEHCYGIAAEELAAFVAMSREDNDSID